MSGHSTESVACIVDEDGGVCGLETCPRCGAPPAEDVAAQGLGWECFDAAPDEAQGLIRDILMELRLKGLLVQIDGSGCAQ